MLRTYQTRLWDYTLHTNVEVSQVLDELARYYSQVERKLFVALFIKGTSVTDAKRTLIKKYEINARQFNSIRSQVVGKKDAYEALLQLRIEDLEMKNKALVETITTKQKQKIAVLETLSKMSQTHKLFKKTVKRYRQIKFVLHQKKRKQCSVQRKLETLQKDKREKKIRICFGSKELFHKQFHLKENGFSHINVWKRRWREQRSSQFYLIGSRDETCGNQNCQYTYKEIGEETKVSQLAITLPKKVMGWLQMKGIETNKIHLHNVFFNHGQKELEWGLQHSKENVKHRNSPLSYRFVKKESKWYTMVSVSCDDPKITSIESLGFIGVDFNATHLSVCEVDRFGNPIFKKDISITMYNKRSGQIEDSLSKAIECVVTLAKRKQKPIVIEKLNFVKKKATLSEESRSYSRMLSGFAYSIYKELFKSKCQRDGVKLIGVNPAYTSQFGALKFMQRYGMSSHQSAACMIARKPFWFSTGKLNNLLGYPYKQTKKKPNWDNRSRRFTRLCTISNELKKIHYFHHKNELIKAN